MTFGLTEELTDEIISAMDNQTKKFAIDAESCSLIESEAVDIDNEKYYELPEWGSDDGFSMLEAFTKAVHIPLVREQLQEVLHSGRGVFRNFRNVLKDYPEIDKRWHIFKHRIMSERVNEWYDSLCEIWGLEKLNHFSETDEDLVRDDFSFREYNSSEDKQTILLNITPDIFDDGKLPQEIQAAFYEITRDRFEKSESQSGIVCYSISEDFAGCFTASSLNKNQEKILIVTSLFVPEEFRGLGIATELIDMFISNISSPKNQWIFIPSIFIPEFLEPLLLRTGFTKTSSGFYRS